MQLILECYAWEYAMHSFCLLSTDAWLELIPHCSL